MSKFKSRLEAGRYILDFCRMSAVVHKSILFVALGVISGLIFPFMADGQIPYFGGTVGNKKFYTYISTKFHPGKNNQIVYGNMEYGLLKNLDILAEFYLATDYGTQGFGLKCNAFESKHVSLGIQSMADFDIKDGYKFAFLSNGLYLSGNICGNLGYVSNSWYTEYRGKSRAFSQWTYLYYLVGKLTPMAGFLNSWSDPKQNCLAIGFIYTLKNSNIYLWAGNLADSSLDTGIVVGFDVKF